MPTIKAIAEQAERSHRVAAGPWWRVRVAINPMTDAKPLIATTVPTPKPPS